MPLTVEWISIWNITYFGRHALVYALITSVNWSVTHFIIILRKQKWNFKITPPPILFSIWIKMLDMVSKECSENEFEKHILARPFCSLCWTKINWVKCSKSKTFYFHWKTIYDPSKTITLYSHMHVHVFCSPERPHLWRMELL